LASSIPVTAQHSAARTVKDIESRDYIVGIIGLGYVGIPLMLAAVAAGFQVRGFDVNAERVDQINAGKSSIKHITDQQMSDAAASGRFLASSEFAGLKECDALLIAVPTPLTKNREPDLSFVVNTTNKIAEHLRPGQLVALESTTWPGTTVEVMRPILERTGLKSGKDFYLAYSPEREDPGNEVYKTAAIPKVVGGDGPEALTVVTALYGALVDKPIPVSTPSTAEAVKLTENIFRAVNIALVNELKVVYERMGIDIWEVIDAAKTKPFGFMPFYPGPGLGGHCIPIDPFYLTWKAREFDITTRFIELAGQINTAMPHYVVQRLREALDQATGRGLNGAHVLMIGVAYKKNVDDMRESPSLRLLELLESHGAEVNYHDPYIPVIPATREHAELAGRHSVALDPKTIAAHDVVLVATDHDGIDWKDLVSHSRLIVDTRNACARAGIEDKKIEKA